MAKKRRYRWQGTKGPIDPARSGEVEVRFERPTAEPEPMTAAQREHLIPLCARLDVPFDPAWSKRRASREITRLHRLERRYPVRRRK